MCKRQKKLLSPSSAMLHRHHHHQQQEEPKEEEERDLINGLPNHISHLVLCKLPPRLLFSVCSSWRRFIYSPLFPPFLSIYALFSNPPNCNIQLMSFDPFSSRWSPHPPPPPPSPPLRLLLRHPSFLSRSLPIQTLSVSGGLVLLAATTSTSTSDDHLLIPLPLPFPLVFSPLSNSWSHGPPLPAPRRWCAAGTLSGSVFVASGIGSHYSSEVARSFDRWDDLLPLPLRDYCCSTGCWHKLGPLKDGRFSREAIDAVGCRGKLWMVNVKGDAAKEGGVYDAQTGAWHDMPDAMIAGWRGPAASMDEREIYVVDERKGILRRYDFEIGGWEDLLESPALQGAQQMAAAGGRVCVVGKDKEIISIVDVSSTSTTTPRIWALQTPPGYHPLAVHVLPRPARS